MSDMRNLDRSVFEEAAHGSFDFDDSEIAEIKEVAENLRAILNRAKEREQKRVARY